VSFIKSPYGPGPGLSVGDPRGAGDHDDALGQSTGIQLEGRTHHNVGEKEIESPEQSLSLIGIYAAAAQVYR